MTTPFEFLKEVDETCKANGRPALSAPLQAVAAAIHAQLIRVEGARITKVDHPVRVLKHVCIALNDQREVAPAVPLALGLAALGHDASLCVKKSTTLVARAPDAERALEEESRRTLRLLHEVDGTMELIKAVIEANQALRTAGQPPIGTDALEIAVRVSAVHDGPSLRSRNALDPATSAGVALTMFVVADGACMVEYDTGLQGPVVGPMVEPWARAESIDREAVEQQMRNSLASLRGRLQAAFGLAKETGLRECFAVSPTLARLAESYVQKWAVELRTTFPV